MGKYGCGRGTVVQRLIGLREVGSFRSLEPGVSS
jgi:hypothetical protein